MLSDWVCFGELFDELIDVLFDGKNVVVYCWGGLGCVGLIVVCLLV